MELVIKDLPGTCIGTPFKYFADWIFEDFLWPAIPKATQKMASLILFYLSVAGFLGT